MEHLFLFLIFLTGCTKFAAAYYLHHRKAIRMKRIIPCLMIACGVSFFSFFFPIRMLYLRFLIALLVFISIYALMDGRFMQKLTVFAVLVFSIESLSLFTSLLLFGFQKGPLSQIQHLLQDLVCILFLCLYGFLRLQAEKRKRLKHILRQLLPLMLFMEAAILLIAITGMFHFTQNGRLWDDPDFSYVMSLLVLLSVMALIWTAVYLFRTNRKVEENAANEKKYAEIRTSYLEALLSREKKTREYRHNLKKQLIYLLKLAEEAEAKKILSYLHMLESDFMETNRHFYHTGNDVIDALTNAYSSILPSDVVLRVKGIITDTGALNSADLCLIYSNLLSNAVEELKRLDGNRKELTVTLMQGAYYIGIKIENTCKDASPLPASGILLTTKPDKENHGIGIRSVQSCVKKHRGEVHFERKDCLFSVDVHLPIAV